MLTRSAKFTDFVDRYGVQLETIIKITIDSTGYLFSRRPMPLGIGTNPVYPLLKGYSGVSEAVDIYSKRFQTSDVSVVLSDEPVYPSTGTTPIRASELLADINGADLNIYLMTGETITDISDCLHIFSGAVLTSPVISNDIFSFSAKDGSKLNDMVLPTNTVESEYAIAPAELKQTPIPIAYGEFSVGVLDFSGHGLAKGVPFEDKQLSFYILAAHETKGAIDGFFNLGGPTVIPIDILIPDTSPSGYTLAKPNPNYNGICRLKFLLTDTLTGVYDDETYLAEDPENVSDGDEFTVADLKDNYLDTTQDMEGLGLWGILYNDLFAKHIQSGGYLKIWYIGLVEGVGVKVTEIEAFLYFGRKDGSDERVQIGYTSNFNIHWGSSIPYAFDIPVSGDYVTSGDMETERYGQKFAAAFRAESGNQSDGDGVTDNQTMADIGELYLFLYQSPTDRPGVLWWQGYGKKYGSWIEGRSLSPTSLFSDYSAIRNAAGIIESLYRDYVGLTDSDIDIDSFSDVIQYESSNGLKARVNIINFIRLSEIVRQLSEQSIFVVCHSGAGKLRVVSLVEPDPIIRATIDRFDVLEDSIHICKTGRIINELIVNSKWQEQYSSFLDRNTYTDSISDGKHRTRSATYNWKNIDEDAAAFVAAHYVNSTNGLWSKEHVQLRFKTPGYKYAHLQAGDWVQVTTDFDDIREPFGGSWQYRNLLVTEVEKNLDHVELTLTEIDETTAVTPSPSLSPEASPSPEPSLSPGAEDGMWLHDDSDDPTSSTLLTGYPGMVDDITEVWVLKPWIDNYSVGIDMSSSIEVRKLRLYDDGIWGAGLQGTPTVYLYTSNDNETWTYKENFSSLSRVATGGVNDPYYIDFTFASSHTARYFKLYAFSGPLKSASGYSLLLSEILATLENSPSPSPSP